MSQGQPGVPVLWDPETLARIRSLQLIARQSVEGVLSGEHRSRRVGASVEFADYKEYQAGDDLRHLDWKVLGRSDRLVTRRYQLETELSSMIVFDASGDLSTGGAEAERGARGWLQRVFSGPKVAAPRPALGSTKFGYAVTLAASLAWALIRRQEPVGLAVIGGETSGVRLLMPRQGQSQLARIIGVLADLRPAGEADLGRTLAAIGPRLRQRSLVCVVSDFMEEPADWSPAMLAFSKRRADIAAFHVMDRQEMHLDFERPAHFFSPEGGDDLAIDPVGAQAEYAKVRDEWLAQVEGEIRAQKGRYYPCLTDAGLDAPLRGLLLGHPGAPLRLERP